MRIATQGAEVCVIWLVTLAALRALFVDRVRAIVAFQSTTTRFVLAIALIVEGHLTGSRATIFVFVISPALHVFVLLELCVATHEFVSTAMNRPVS